MFSLQNPDYNFTQSYITCVGNKMSDIKPFGTIPDRLQRNLKLALMASRTFIQGLAVGRNVVMQAQKVSDYIKPYHHRTGITVALLTLVQTAHVFLGRESKQNVITILLLLILCSSRK